MRLDALSLKQARLTARTLSQPSSPSRATSFAPSMLLRQIAGLIQVPDKERGLARQRALEQLKASQ
jgi:hypothetical protein